MPKLNVLPSLDNDPKKQFLINYNMAFAEGNVDFLREHADENIHWNMVGNQEIQSINAFIDCLESMKEVTAKEVTIEHIITNGNMASVSGAMEMDNGDKYAFCDVLQFTNDVSNIVKAMTSYVIKIS